MRRTSIRGTVLGMLVLWALCGAVLGADSNSGLIGHWAFDEGTGSVAYDSAGTHDGSVYGAQWATGILGTALYFDGVDDYVGLPDNNPVWLPQNDFTLCTWAYFHQDVFENETLLDLNWGDSQVASRRLGYSLFRLRDGKGRFDVITENGIQNTLATRFELTKDKWYHIVAVRNGTVQQIYLDGVLDNQRTCPPDPVDFVGTYDNDEVHIGNYNRLGNVSSTNWQANATVDDVRIYDRALSAEETEYLYLYGSLPTAQLYLDIKPGSCPNPLNLASRGVLPVAILGTEEFDVTGIDTASIRLEGVAPARSHYEDVATPVTDGNECECNTEGPDGYLDLTLKFKTQQVAEEIVNSLGDISAGDELVLTLTGTLTDGTPIVGEDCVVIVGKAPRSLAARRSDLNEDGIVNSLDFAALSKYWLESAAPE